MWDQVVAQVVQVLVAQLADAGANRLGKLVRYVRQKLAEHRLAHLLDALAADPGDPQMARLRAAVLQLVMTEPGTGERLAELLALEQPLGDGVDASFPPEPSVVVGRNSELATVTGSKSPVTVLSGQEGIGKTTIATRFAHSAKTRYPRPIYVDLNRFRGSGNATPLGEAAAYVLTNLEVDHELIEPELTARLEQCRSAMAQRPVLIVLDNVTTAAEVTGLVPLSPANAVLAAAVTAPEELLAAGSTWVALPALPTKDGVELLTSVCGEPLVEAEPAAVVELVELCEGLPLAVRMVAARVRRHALRSRQPIADVLDELRDIGVASGIEAVGAALEATLGSLSEHAVTLCRLLSAQPALDFGDETAAVITGAARGVVSQALTELGEVGFVDQIADGPRYRLRGLVRDHLQDTPPDHAELDRAFDRLVGHYLPLAVAADLACMGQDRLRCYDTGLASATAEFGRAAARDWLEAEQPLLHELVSQAHLRGRHRDVVTLCGATEPLFLWHPRDPRWLATYRAGVDSAEALDDDAARARAASQYAKALTYHGRFEQARRHLDRAWDRAVRSENLRLMSSVREYEGRWFEDQERHAEAAGAFRRAVAIDRHALTGEPDRRALGLHCRMLANVLAKAARSSSDAVTLLNEAADRIGEAEHLTVDDARNRSRVLTVRGKVLLASERWDEAGVALRDALELARRNQNSAYYVEILESLGHAAEGAGEPDTARRHWAEALRDCVAAGNHTRADQLRQWLSRLSRRDD